MRAAAALVLVSFERGWSFRGCGREKLFGQPSLSLVNFHNVWGSRTRIVHGIRACLVPNPDVLRPDMGR
jgi:hypothetical protein